MRTALIVGINGNFGGHMALALREQGWSIRALMRDPAKAPPWLEASSIVAGRAQDMKSIAAAAQGVDLIVYAANPPYHRWSQEAMAMLEPSLAVAEAQQLQVLFPGNVYGYAPQEAPISEHVSMHPPTQKGAIRQQMEQRLAQAAARGAKVLIVRAGDFIGPGTTLTWAGLMTSVKGKRVVLKLPHDGEHRHYYSYLPDLCRNAAQLLNMPLGSWEVFHDPGLVVSKADWLDAYEKLGLTARATAFPWWGLRVAGLFSPMLREVYRMRYLWREPVILDGNRMKDRLGFSLHATELTSVITTSLLNAEVAGSEPSHLKAGDQTFQ